MMKEKFLIGFVIFLLIYITLKSLIFWRKFKVNPLSFTKGVFREKMSWYSLIVIFSLYMVHIALFYFDKLNIFVSNPLLDLMGYALFTFGFILGVIAHYQMGTSWRMGNDYNKKTKLVTNGLFGYTRNPVYVWLIIQSFAILLLIPNIFSLVLFILILIIINLIVSQEEKFLEKQFGKEYLEYKKRVRRFI